MLAGYIIRREVEETPAFTEESAHHEIPKAPVLDALTHHWPDMLRVVCMALMNVIPVVATIFGAAYAVQPGYGIGFDKSVYLWIPVVGNIVAVIVIPFVGDLSDRVGRRPPIIVGSLAAGLLSFAYLYAISIGSVLLASVFSILMWGIVYQGYNAVFPLLPRTLSDAGARLRNGDRPEHRHDADCAPARAVCNDCASRLDQRSVDNRRLRRGDMAARGARAELVQCSPIAVADPYVERLIGTIRRDCLDHMIVFGEEAHLRRILGKYAAYYNESRLLRSDERMLHRCERPTAKRKRRFGDGSSQRFGMVNG